jgi:capsid assembly protease
MNKHRLPHLAQKAINTPLAIIPEKLELMLGIVGERFNLGDIDVEAVKTHADVLSRDRKDYEVSQDGVAIIPVQGTLLKKTVGLWAMSGFSSYQGLQAQIAECMEDPNVRGILFDIDSPGGETAGCFELVDYLYSLRGDKPFYAAANDLAASAAYAFASACDRIFVTRMGCVGSIGVFCLHVDQSGYDEEMGFKFKYIYNGSHKTDGNQHEKLSTDAEKALQSEIDRQAAIFQKTVARNRGVKLQKVIDTQAACFYPGNDLYDALPMLADEVGTLEDACQALTEKITGIKTINIGAISPTERNADMPAIPPHKTATSDSPWDGPKAKANLKNDGEEAYYRKAYAWQNADGDPKTKSAYKFIHHEVAEGGEVGAANLKGCSTGIGVLNGGRGGTVIPKADRKGVYNHLAKHLRDGDEEPPDFKGESYVGKQVSFAIEGMTHAGAIEEEARDILFVKSEVAGKIFILPCRECSLLDEEEFAAIAAESKEATSMAKKNAIAAGKDEECAADDMGPEMAGDEEGAEKSKDKKPEKDKEPADDEAKKSKKATKKPEAAKEPEKDDDPDDDDNDDDDPDDEDKEDDADKPKPPKHEKITERHEKITERKASSEASDLKQIATLCQIAGKPELAASFITDGLNVKQVQEKLVNLRADASNSHQLSNRVGTSASKSMDALIASATEDARRSKTSAAVAIAKALDANPEIYAAYKRTLPDFRSRD